MTTNKNVLLVWNITYFSLLQISLLVALWKPFALFYAFSMLVGLVILMLMGLIK